MEKFKKYLNVILLVVMCLFLLLVGVSYASNDTNTLKRYENALQAEKNALQEARRTSTNRCIAEKDLAKEKLASYYSDDLTLTQEDIDRLEPKTKWTCEYSEAVFK